MKRFISILILSALVLAPYAQQKQRTKRPAKTTAKKVAVKSATKAPTSVQALEKQRQQIQRKIKEQERLLKSNEQDVKKRLRNLMFLNSEIEGKRRTIDTIKNDITSLEYEIEMLLEQFDLLQAKLEKNKKNYVKSMRYMHRNRSVQNQLMFIFSADNLTQMARRIRFMREYASFQRVQGERVKAEEEEVNLKFQQITSAQQHKQDLLQKGEEEQRSLEGKQIEQKHVVQTLQKEQKTIQGIIAQQKKKDAALNAQIDRLLKRLLVRKLEQQLRPSVVLKPRLPRNVLQNWLAKKPQQKLLLARMPVALPKPRNVRSVPNKRRWLPRTNRLVKLLSARLARQQRPVWWLRKKPNMKLASMLRKSLRPVRKPRLR